MNYNTEKMLRVLRCKKCQISITSTAIEPRCETCNQRLITVVRSVVTEQQITGMKDEVNYEEFR